MSTLKRVDFDLMEKQIENAKGKLISKEEVLLIFHNKLKQIDAKNKWIIDQWDGIAVKELINSINNL